MDARIIDRFADGPLPYWVRFSVGPTTMLHEAGRLRFVVEGAARTQLADVEIGDYRLTDREHLPWRPPLRLMVRARFSHPASLLRGTCGFGFWNNPFAPAGRGVVAPPNDLWFFCASPQSDLVAAPGLPGNGFRAEMINGGTMPAWAATLGNLVLRLPRITPLLYRAAQTRMNAASVRLDGFQMTHWHDYVLYWDRAEAVFTARQETTKRAPGLCGLDRQPGRRRSSGWRIHLWPGDHPGRAVDGAGAGGDRDAVRP
jgi:hypothetical protein